MYEVRYTTMQEHAYPSDPGVSQDPPDDRRSAWFGVVDFRAPGALAYEARPECPAQWTQTRFLDGPDDPTDGAHYVYLGAPGSEAVERERYMAQIDRRLTGRA